MSGSGIEGGGASSTTRLGGARRGSGRRLVGEFGWLCGVALSAAPPRRVAFHVPLLDGVVWERHLR